MENVMTNAVALKEFSKRFAIKTGIFFLSIPASMLIGILIGFALSQLSYTLSPEYFDGIALTQFAATLGLVHPRAQAGFAGAISIAWLVLYINFALAMGTLIFKAPREMLC